MGPSVSLWSSQSVCGAWQDPLATRVALYRSVGSRWAWICPRLNRDTLSLTVQLIAADNRLQGSEIVPIFCPYVIAMSHVTTYSEIKYQTLILTTESFTRHALPNNYYFAFPWTFPFLTLHTYSSWASKAMGRRGRVPVTNLWGDVPSRFENEVAQIRHLFRFLWYFGGRLATCRRFVPPTQKSVATPLLLIDFIQIKQFCYSISKQVDVDQLIQKTLWHTYNELLCHRNN